VDAPPLKADGSVAFVEAAVLIPQKRFEREATNAGGAVTASVAVTAVASTLLFAAFKL
jgi:hypothetical protein